MVNTGNENVNGITVEDSLVKDVDCSGATSLGPGEKFNCTASYTVTALDVKRKGVVNKATAIGLGNPSGIAVIIKTTASAKWIAGPKP